MIEITIAPGRIAAMGHADDGAGCAAVSALLYALAGGLENIGGSPSWFVQDGEAEIEIGSGAQAQAMRLMAEVGLRQIAAAREDIRIVEQSALRRDGVHAAAGALRRDDSPCAGVVS